MPHSNALFRTRMVGDDHFPRYIVRDNRRLVDHYYTGWGWSRHVRDARLYADPDRATNTVKRLTRRHLRRHEPKRLFTLTIVVRVHADESVTRGDIETYLNDALVVRVDHERHGTGPTSHSLVEVVVPLISLEGGR